MKRQFFIGAFIGLALLLTGCSKGFMESGDEAFQQQNYTEALKYYLEAAKEFPNDPALKEKIALSYFREGELFYEKRQTVKGFEARVNSGLAYLPDNPSPELLSATSDIHLKLAIAYKNTKADNPFQQKKNFETSLKFLEKSLGYDSSNVEANQIMRKFKEENFIEIFEKGMTAYTKGSKDPLQYIAADHYLTNATFLDPSHSEAAKYLNLARKKALNVLDPGFAVPIAITDQMENTDYVAYLVVVYNLLPEHLSVSAGNLYLIKKDGKEIRGKTSGQFTTPLVDKTIANGEETAGVVAFPLPADRNFTRLEFRSNGKMLGYKNLP
jgi:tetratricopeptide (TPR) repeat protein